VIELKDAENTAEPALMKARRGKDGRERERKRSGME